VYGKVVRRVHVTLDAATVTETILTRDGPTPVAGIDFGLLGSPPL
jgi:hypothetical protein